MKLFSIFILFFLIPSLFYSQAELKGVVTDSETGESIIYGTVAIYKNDVLITGAETNLDGYYSIKELPAGIYKAVFSYTGYADQKVTIIQLHNGEIITLDCQMTAGSIICYSTPCGSFDPLIKLDDTTQGFKFSSEQISRMALRW